jgi:uncharacterized protein DUF1902
VQQSIEIAHRRPTIVGPWDPEAEVWIATSPDLRGLVLEAETWPKTVHEAELVISELLEVSR